MSEAARRLAGAQRFLGALVLLVLVAVIAVLRGNALLYDHSLHSIDGAMQTWFALDNFADGKQLGSEFQSYLGVTMILALLPIFSALGETLFASTMAAYVWVIAGAFISAYATAWMIDWIPAKQRWIAAIALVAGFYVLGRFIADSIGIPYPLSFDPGVSLRPVRGLLPFLVLPVFIFAVRDALKADALHRSAFAGAVLGLVAGAGLLWSNDAGIPLLTALVIGLAGALLSRPRHLAAVIAGLALSAAVSATLLLLIVTHGEPQGWLHYNFVAVAGDQFWYFAPWARESRVLAIPDVLRILTGGELLSTVSLIVLIASVFLAAFQRLSGRGDAVRLSGFIFVGSSLIGTAILPQIGGHIGGEYNHITFLLGMSAPLILMPANLSEKLEQGARALPAMAVSAIALVATGTTLASEGWRTQTVIAASDRTEYAPELGFYVTLDVAEDLAAMERLSEHWDEQATPQDRRMLSVYTSILDVQAGVESPQPVGSLIHALGPKNRVLFTAQVSNRNVALVTTIAPDYSGWEGWNLRANWPFFESLRTYYEPLARTDQQIVWQRSRGSGPIGEARCIVEPLGDHAMRVTLDANVSGIASIQIRRQPPFGSGRTAVLTVTEDSPFTRGLTDPAWSDFPRYGVANARLVHIPAPVEQGERTELTLEVMDGSSIGPASCSASVFRHLDFATLPRLNAALDTYLAEEWR